MMKKAVLLLCLLMAVTPEMMAKKKKVVEQKPAPPKREVRAKAKQGLFNVQHHKDDWYFQIADSLLGRPFLASTRFISTPAEAGVYGGEQANSTVLYWEKQGKQILLRTLMYEVVTDSTEEISKAVRAANEDPIVASLKIDSTLTDTLKNKLYSVKVTDLFKGESPVFSLFSRSKDQMGLSGVKADLSYIDDIRTYPINTEIITVKTFTAKPNSKIPAGRETGLVKMKLNTSLVLLPKEPMRYRTFDPRVGYFASRFSEFKDDQHQVKRKTIAARWRLEPKDEEAYKRGELVEPKKQIVYYIDPATPKQWRKYLIQGVEDWNTAFEQAGFKNAIAAKEWPNDSTMSLEDARYSVIRYLASPISNAYGPHTSDPRSGEILETHIGWYHNVMQLVHDWYMIQAGAIDQRARKMKFDDELMGELIRFVSSHEVGHTLGLRHNMGASSATPTDSLRNKTWVEKYGHTASIMDYARFNYVAQPEDNISEAGIFPRINDYDKWAIEWGYRYFPEAKDADEERLALNKMTIAQLKKSKRFWFGGEGSDNDPRAQTEDLGDDPFKASDYGVKNLKYIVKRLPEWSYEEGDLGDNLQQVYTSLISQMRRYTGHICRNLAGVYHNYKSVEEPGAVYQVEEKARQKKALQWLDKNILTRPDWLINEDYVMRFSQQPEKLIRPLADQAVGILCSTGILTRLESYSYAKDSYKPEDYVNDVIGMIFRETATGSKVSSWRAYIQRQAVQGFIKSWGTLPGDNGHASVTLALNKIKSRLSAAHPQDAYTKAHYDDLLQQIKLAFDGVKQQTASSSTTAK